MVVVRMANIRPTDIYDAVSGITGLGFKHLRFLHYRVHSLLELVDLSEAASKKLVSGMLIALVAFR